ncbi:MAG: 50S ribosomal protein L11 methyltransferase, partial [Gammaproteobacteria bacterium]|nr:50S ribosomal protein L11 methyltransferase [Gammaproteobacteria bacterium]
MPWLQVETLAGQRDPQTVERVLSELGAAAVWLKDAGDEPILEPAPGETPGWSETLVTALFTADFREADLRAALDDTVPGIEWRFAVVEDQDWQSAFEQTLRPLRFSDRLWVIPDGSPAPDHGAVVRLAPGMAFGTGEHPTTAMCLQWLAQQALDHAGVLDYGCGSGLLAIAALKLGASRCCAVDIDPQALDATAENAASNAVADRLIIVEPDAVPAGAQYDVLVANILSGTLIDLGPV